jgi:hypothetical protein
MRRRIVFVPISMEAAFLIEVRSDFTTEILRKDIEGLYCWNTGILEHQNMEYCPIFHI